MLPQEKIDDGTLKMCKVEVKRNRRDSNIEKTSRIIGGTTIKAGFQINSSIFSRLDFFKFLITMKGLFMAMDGSFRFSQQKTVRSKERAWNVMLWYNFP